MILKKQGAGPALPYETWNKLEKQEGVKWHPFILLKNKDTAVFFLTVSLFFLCGCLLRTQGGGRLVMR